MFTTLIAVIAAVALGHVAPGLLAALRPDLAWRALLAWLGERFGEDGGWGGRYGLVALLLPPLLLVLLLQWGLGRVLWGLPGMLFGVLVLLLCWGPRDLDVDVEAVLDADDPQARHARLQELSPQPGQGVGEGPVLAGPLLRSALRRWFAPLFWFLLLGPAGALMYRLVERSAIHAQVLPADNAAGAWAWLRALEWPVAQLMTLTLALVGNFDLVYRAWRGAGGDEPRLESGFLEAAARAAVSGELEEEAEDYRLEGRMVVPDEMPELRDAMSLVWRMLLLWLALLALLVIAGWVG